MQIGNPIPDLHKCGSWRIWPSETFSEIGCGMRYYVSNTSKLKAVKHESIVEMGREKIHLTAEAADALLVLGQQVRMARNERKLTTVELAARASVSPQTVSSIERGSGTVSAGNLFNVAVAVGVRLFGADDEFQLAILRRTGQEKLALIPARVRHAEWKSDAADF